MGSTSTLTPTLRRGSNFSVSSPSTPKDFLSPTSQLRRARPVILSTLAGTLAENDDATEKQQRQKSRVNALVVQSPAATTPKSASRINSVEGSAFTVNGRTNLTNAQLKDLYSNCLKLSTENKINSKNAFGLQLIDYMQEFLTNVDKDQGVTNFQIASCTLDAGAKIYAGRVDSIHAQAYKMLGGLGRAENANEDGEVPDNAEPHNDDANVAKKKKTRKAAKIIESNLNNINTDQFDLQFEADPLFQKLSATFDEGGTSSLLLNHLSRRDDFCETLFDSKTVPTSAVADFNWANSQAVDCSDMRDLIMRVLSPSVEICPQYGDFSFTNWDLNSETAKENETSGNDEDAFDMNAPGPAPFDAVSDMPDTNGDGFDHDDAGGFDDDPGDMTTNDPGTLIQFADNQEAQLLLPGQPRPSETALGSGTDLGTFMLSLQSSETLNEYSYSSLPMWAGPAQWKNRAQFDDLKGLSKGSRKRKTTTKKKVFRIDFDATHDFDKLFSKGKAATVLTKTTMDKHASNEKILPENVHYEFSNLMKLLLKSKLLARRQFGVQSAITDDGNGNNWYNFENENDCANYCPAEAQDDGGDDDDDDDVFGSEDVGGFNEYSSQEMSQTLGSFNNETVFHGDNLVAQPNKVQKIDIAYSKTAKKIDVKKVKKAMWNIMSSTCDADKENVPENSARDNVFKDRVTKPCTFTELYHTMPSKISKQMANNLSIATAFVCLLHLANEKNLNIEGRQSMDDFVITQGI